jgi:REP element-mobilizing transposase RayT
MYDPKIHHRRSIRWTKHDYSSPGAYYVTICIQDGQCLLGDVADGIMNPNDAGHMVEAAWFQIPTRFPAMKLDEHIVMPNHFHGIIHIVGARLVGAQSGAAQIVGDQTGGAQIVGAQELGSQKRAGTRPAPTLGDAVGAFKSIATDEYIGGVKQRDWPRFNKRFWQRNYFEHVIRDQDELEKIRDYIRKNPMMWTIDRYNPEHGVPVVDETGRVVPWNET